MGGAAGFTCTALYTFFGMDHPTLVIMGFVEDIGSGGADIIAAPVTITEIIIYYRMNHFTHPHPIISYH